MGIKSLNQASIIDKFIWICELTGEFTGQKLSTRAELYMVRIQYSMSMGI